MLNRYNAFNKILNTLRALKRCTSSSKILNTLRVVNMFSSFWKILNTLRVVKRFSSFRKIPNTLRFHLRSDDFVVFRHAKSCYFKECRQHTWFINCKTREQRTNQITSLFVFRSLLNEPNKSNTLSVQ